MANEFRLPLGVAMFADMGGPGDDWEMLADEYGIPEPRFLAREIVFPASAREAVLERLIETGQARLGGDSGAGAKRAIAFVERETCNCKGETVANGRRRLHETFLQLRAVRTRRLHEKPLRARILNKGGLAYRI